MLLCGFPDFRRYKRIAAGLRILFGLLEHLYPAYGHSKRFGGKLGHLDILPFNESCDEKKIPPKIYGIALYISANTI